MATASPTRALRRASDRMPELRLDASAFEPPRHATIRGRTDPAVGAGYRISNGEQSAIQTAIVAKNLAVRAEVAGETVVSAASSGDAVMSFPLCRWHMCIIEFCAARYRLARGFGEAECKKSVLLVHQYTFLVLRGVTLPLDASPECPTGMRDRVYSRYRRGQAHARAIGGTSHAARMTDGRETLSAPARRR